MVHPARSVLTRRFAWSESIDEIHSFITCAYEVDSNWADVVVAKLCSGSRYGEITALLVASLKPRGIELLRRQSSGTIRPGTKAGTNIWRFAPLPPLLLDIIKLRVAQLGQQDRIFHGPRGDKWAYQPYWRRWDTLGDLLRAEGIDMHLTRGIACGTPATRSSPRQGSTRTSSA